MKQGFVYALALAIPLAAEVKISKSAGRIEIDIDGKPFTTFFIGQDAPKPYLHPLRAATGTVVTRGYPIQEVAGESKDHPHHRGLWFTHGDVNGVDFWANEPSQKSDKRGAVVLKKLNAATSGKQSGLIDATFEWVDPKGTPVLTEERKMTFYSQPDMRTIDFDITLRAVHQAVFGDTKEGTFAIRLAAGLEEKAPKSLPDPPRTGKMVSSEGAEGESQVWGKRAPWVDYSGELEGEKVGIAILDHSANPKHPTYWHARSYGLFAANIFGEHDFYNDKSRNGSVTLTPGETLRFRYRVLIHPGDFKSAEIAKKYKKYLEVAR